MITLQKLLSLKQNNLEGITINPFFLLKRVDFLSVKKRPNINLFVEYSRTYGFSSILSLLIKPLKFTQQLTCSISKNVLCKVGISILVHIFKGNFRLCNRIEFKLFFVNNGNS